MKAVVRESCRSARHDPLTAQPVKHFTPHVKTYLRPIGRSQEPHAPHNVHCLIIKHPLSAHALM